MKIYSLLLVSTILISCSLFKPKEILVPTPVYIQQTIQTQPRPEGLTLFPAIFDVVTEETLQEFLNENRKRNGVLVFAALDISSYENLSFNMADIQRYILQMIALVEYYEEAATVEEEVQNAE